MKPVLLFTKMALSSEANFKNAGKFLLPAKTGRSLKGLLMLAIFILASAPVFADTFVSFTNSGYWDDVNSWKQNNGKAKRLPDSQDDVTIANGDLIMIRYNADCASLTIKEGAGTASLIWISPATLTVTGAVTVNNPNNSTNVQNTNALTIGVGTLRAESLHINANNGGTAPRALVSITTGSLYLSNDLSYAGGAKARFELGENGYLEIGGDLGAGVGGFFDFHSNSTVNFKGNAVQRLRTVYSFGNIRTNNPQGVRPDGPVTPSVLKGNLIVETGIFNNNGFAIQGPAGKNLLVTNQGTLALTGTTSFPTGFSNSILQDFSTVVYGGTTQAVAPRPYGNLKLITEAPATASEKTLNGNASVISNLDFGAAKLIMGPNTLTVEANASVTNASAAGYVVQSGQSKFIIKNLGITGNGRGAEFIFPVGTTSSYTPAYLTNYSVTNDFSVKVADGISDKYGNPVSERVVNKTWYINQETSAGTPSLNMRLQWNPGDETPNFNRFNCGISHFENGEWRQPASFNPAEGVSGTGPFVAARGDIQSFSPFGIGDNLSPLPVELKYFNAVKKGNKALLQWETATEKNSLGFELQASADGRRFETIGFVASRNPNSNVSQRYEFLEPTGREGKWYYRLAQKDLDGTLTLFSIKVLDFSRLPESIGAYPNPFEHQFNLKITATTTGNTSIRVTDLSGKMVWSATQKLEIGENHVEVPLNNNLPAGVYLITTECNGQLNHLRMVKK